MTTQGAIVADGIGASADEAYASWLRRVVAALLDSAVLAAISFVALSDDRGPGLTFLPGVGTAGTASGGWIIAVFALVLIMQAYTGSTPGKLVVGIAVVDTETGRPLGIVRTVLRLLAHFLDAILMIGYLRPLWDRRHRTFADSLMGSVAVMAPYEGWRRRVFPAALVACIVSVMFFTGESGSSTSFWVSCAVTPAAGGGSAQSVSATWHPAHAQRSRLGFTRMVRVADHGDLEVSWAGVPSYQDGGTVHVHVVDTQGETYDAEGHGGATELTMSLGDATPAHLTVEHSVDGDVRSRCEVDAP